jgi:hypothetical protein
MFRSHLRPKSTCLKEYQLNVLQAVNLYKKSLGVMVNILGAYWCNTKLVCVQHTPVSIKTT